MAITPAREVEFNFDRFYNVIDGNLETTPSTRRGVNPSTLQPNPEVPVASKNDVDRAIQGARKGFQTWSKVPIDERRLAIIAFSKSIAEHRNEFVKMLITEQGKPFVQAASEVDASVKWLTDQASLSLPDEIVEDTDERKVVTTFPPLGVAALIVPWNFPILLACGKIAPALLAGNALILKPSPFTPYCGIKLAELAQKHFPPGVFQALSGEDNIGPMLTEHPDIDKVSFTGSTETGKRVLQSCSKTMKRVTLELGGKDPAIICDDVNLDTTVPQIAQFVWANSGQVCIAVKRVYVHADIYAKFMEIFVKVTKSLVIGDGFTNANLGPLQNEMQFNRIQSFLADIERNKYQIAAGGGSNAAKPGAGYFVTPTVVDNPPDNSMIVTDEPFGPIIPILKWASEDDVVDRANNSRYGLGASVWTQDSARASRIAKRLNAGTVWVNTHMGLDPLAAFGGYKESGFGTEWGIDGLKSYTNTQTLFWKKT